MARVWVGAALAVLGLVAAVMAAGGLPWSMRPVGAPAALGASATVPAPVPVPPAPTDDPARHLTELALRQLRQAKSPDDMSVLTQAVVRDLLRNGGTSALERAVRQAAKAAPADDAFVKALRAEAQGGGADMSDRIRARVSDILARPAPRP